MAAAACAGIMRQRIAGVRAATPTKTDERNVDRITLAFFCSSMVRLANTWQLLAPDLATYPPNLAEGQKAPEAEGICHLRLGSAMETIDKAGVMVESVTVHTTP